jgi:DNA helicase-2/ATP-dependent DNA helicase PcrA
MPWDDNLSDEQRAASSFTGSHARLLAGPGTGKTLCLTRRIVCLLTTENVQPSEVLVLTFTRAATAELRGRISQGLEEGAELPVISTLHSFALKTLLRYASGTSLPQPIRIADDYEEKQIIREDIKNLMGLRRIRQAEELIQQLSSDWEQLRVDEPDYRAPNPQFMGAWNEHRQKYGYVLRAELVYQLKRALEEGQIRFDSNYRHVLVDEYQDLNACDLAVINQLTNNGAELFVAGDDDQSIYGFRYANPDGIRRFSDTYVPSESLVLEECRRCDRSILDLSQYVARQDTRRLDKPLHASETAEDGLVRILRFPTQNEEAQAITSICSRLVNEHNVAPGNILILLRLDKNEKFSKPIRAALEAAGLEAATVANPLAPLNEVEGRRYISILRLIVNPQDHLSWRTMLEIRHNNIGPTTINSINNLAQERGISFSAAIDLIKENPAIINRGNLLATEIEEIEGIVTDARGEAQNTDLSEFLHDLAEEHIDEERERRVVVEIFSRVLRGGNIETIEQLLRAINVSIENGEQDVEDNAVNIMTMHQAKGLSADAVFVVAAEEEYIPGRAQGAEIEDERRLLYVSLTRARNFLFVTHCARRTGQQRHSGSTSGNPNRRLTIFLSGGPIPSIPGNQFSI